MRHIPGVVDVVIAAASNFGGTVKGSSCEEDETQGAPGNGSMLEWEHGLYSGGGGEGTAEEARKKCYSVLLSKLHKLIDSMEFDSADELIANAINSEDDTLHEVLYSDLLKTDQVERLIRIQSPRLEKFLNATDKGLLWRHHIVHGRHSEACSLMSARGLSKEKISLDERIACFTRAVNSAVAVEGAGEDHLFQLSQLKEYLEVAGVQRQVLSAISTQVREGTCEAEVEDDLNFRLLDVSEMYNDICGPYCLWELCLVILLICNMSDQDNIRLLWRAIICDELPADSENEDVLAHLLDMRTGVPVRAGVVQGLFEDGDWIMRVKNKLISVARGLWGRGSDYTVPLDMLAFELEGLRRCWGECSEPGAGRGEGGDKGNWVIAAFIEIGIEWSTLVDCYCNVLSDRERKGADRSERLHYLRAIVEILSKWCREGAAASGGGLRRGGGTLTLDNVKSQLQTLVGGGDAVEEVFTQVREIESMLR